MAIEFCGSKEPTLGVEVELQMIDPKTRKLISKARDVIERCRQRDFGHVKAEIHQSMLEIDTPISKNVQECESNIQKTLSELNSVAKELGIKLSMAGTHPFEHWSDSQVFPKSRYKKVSEKFQWLAKRVTVYGMHVHVGVPSGNAALRVMNGAVPYLPLLLALSANSPFWQGIDTGLEGCRIGVMDSFPYSGLPIPFSCWEEYEAYCEYLLNNQVIDCFKDIYWHVRPNAEFGTVEFRVCDTMATVDEITAVVAFIQCLVVWLLKKSQQSTPLPKEIYWVAPENQWIAIRDGIDGMIVPQAGGARVKIADEITKTIDLLMPTARELGVEPYLKRVKTMLQTGSGARRQRAVYKQSGSLEAVVDKLIEEFHQAVPMTTHF